MSKAYREFIGDPGPVVTTAEMRSFVQRPGMVDDEGKILYRTEQNHKKECDINLIIKKYDKTGLISHISKFEGEFGDLRGVDYKTALDQVTRAGSLFNQLPSNIRNRFSNNPEKLLSFMENPANRDEAIKLGLINKHWTEDTDGLGEHVPEGGNVKKDEDNT